MGKIGDLKEGVLCFNITDLIVPSYLFNTLGLQSFSKPFEVLDSHCESLATEYVSHLFYLLLDLVKGAFDLDELDELRVVEFLFELLDVVTYLLWVIRDLVW